jgi:hypothetical protein
LVHLDEQGVLQQGDGLRLRSPAPGVKIIFSEKDGPQKTLYYFSTNLADEYGKNLALLQFTKSLGEGDSFVKSASYLMHKSNFSQVRNFILDSSSLILQDDTGVPVRLFDTAKWQLRPFGRYVNPIAMFEGMYQLKLSELYYKIRPSPIDFGVGYRWYPNESNLLLAIRNTAAPEMTAAIAKDAPRRNVEFETAATIKYPIYRAPSYPRNEFEPIRTPDAPPFFPLAISNGKVVGQDPDANVREMMVRDAHR